jgi:hypothetical protein
MGAKLVFLPDFCSSVVQMSGNSFNRLVTRDDDALIVHRFLWDRYTLAEIVDFVESNGVSHVVCSDMMEEVCERSVPHFAALIAKDVPCVTRVSLYLPNLTGAGLVSLGHALESNTHITRVELFNHYNTRASGSPWVSLADAAKFGQLVGGRPQLTAYTMYGDGFQDSFGVAALRELYHALGASVCLRQLELLRFEGFPDDEVALSVVGSSQTLRDLSWSTSAWECNQRPSPETNVLLAARWRDPRVRWLARTRVMCQAGRARAGGVRANVAWLMERAPLWVVARVVALLYEPYTRVYV